MIRMVRKYKAFWKIFLCWDLTVEDHILITKDFEAWFEKILSEFNKEIPELDLQRTQDLYNKITRPNSRADKQTNNAKNEKKNDKKQEEQDPLKDFHILESSLMKILHQPLSEIRSWTVEYFFMVLDDLDVIVWEKSLNDKRNAERPDRHKIKNLLWNFYSNKK